MKWWGWAAVTVLLGLVLRVPMLDLRPMHTDEAVHALKLGTLLETGVYRYDPNEYHGPTLNYFTLLPAYVAGEETLSDLSEATLRIVPAMFGIGMILLILSLREAGPVAMSAAAFLAASSPMMSFYSRYYIQETLLVCFTMGLIAAGYLFLVRGRTRWALAAGLSAGLMFATKETWVISIGSMGVALMVTMLMRRREGAPPLRVRWYRVALGAAAGVAISALFFSSFLSYPEGVLDSVLAYENYLGRAGEDSKHGGPWYYFIRMLSWWDEGMGQVWTEPAVVVFGVLGIVGSFLRPGGGVRPRSGATGMVTSTSGANGKASSLSSVPGDAGSPAGRHAEGPLARDLRIFLGTYAVLMLLIISILPYKTPWLVLGALLPLILMAGWGVSVFLAWLPSRVKIPGYLLLAVLGGHLVWQSYLANFEYYDDPSNPMVYSHPNDDVRRIAGILEDAALASPEPLSVQVVVSGDEYWPLPWYLRRLRQVGWWDRITDEFAPTPVVLVSPDREQDLLERLYESPPPGQRPLYVPLFDRPMFLRPGREVRGYVTLDLSNRLRETRG